MKKLGILIAIISANIFLASGCTPSEFDAIVSDISNTLPDNAGAAITETKSVSLDKNQTLHLDTSVVDLDISEADVSKVEIELKTYENGPKLTIKEGTVLEIIADTKKNNINWGNKAQPRMTVKIPKSFEGTLELETDVGDVDVYSIACDKLDASGDVGDWRIENIQTKALNVKMDVGDLKLRKIISDKIEIDSDVGDVDAQEIEGNIIGKIDTGDAHFELEKIVGDFSFEGDTGDISIYLPKRELIDASFDIAVDTGDLSMNHPLDEISEKSEDRLKGLIGKGTYKFTIQTSTGDIVLK